MRASVAAACTMAALLLAGCGAMSGASREAGSSPTPLTRATVPTPSTTTPNPDVLAPATSTSQVGICSEPLAYDADGTVRPLLCANGSINALAWAYLSPGQGYFAAGSNLTPAEADHLGSTTYRTSTGPIAEDEYCLAKAYYGWQFGVSYNPETFLLQAEGLTATASCAADIPDWP